MLFYELVNLIRFCKIFYNRKIWFLIFAKSLSWWNDFAQFCTHHENILDLQGMKLTFWSVERKVTIFFNLNMCSKQDWKWFSDLRPRFILQWIQIQDLEKSILISVFWTLLSTKIQQISVMTKRLSNEYQQRHLAFNPTTNN